MYFSLRCNKDSISYLICKHPDNTYKEVMGKNRVITGKFSHCDDGKTLLEYNFNLKPDTVDFIKIAKQRNLPFYLNSELYSVCPYNLNSFYVIFRSVIRGINTSSEIITDKEFNEKDFHSAVLGPFCVDFEHVEKVFGYYGLKVYKRNDLTPMGIDDPISYSLIIESESKISLTEFLQKIYILSTYCTYHRKHSIFYVTEDVVNKIIHLSKNWLRDHDYNKHIINKFCKNKQNLREIFEQSLSEEDIEDKVDLVNEKLKKISLHTKRHDLLINYLHEKQININTIVDFCTSEGKLLKKLSESYPDSRILGIEKVFDKIAKFGNKNPNHRIIESNILYPNISEGDLLPDLLTCVEAIEHFNEDGRKHMLQLIKEVFVPKYIYITTPNIEYNKIYGMEDGVLRRKDHIIEYTIEQFKEEVEIYLSSDYNIEYLNVIEPEECFDSIYIQPSICIFATHKSITLSKQKMITISKPYPNKDEYFTQEVPAEEWAPEDIEEWMNNLDFRKIRPKYLQYKRKVDFKLFGKLKEHYGNIFLPISGYCIKEKELNMGYTSNVFLNNADNIFYLGPNIAPVEYMKGDEFLERAKKFECLQNFSQEFTDIVIKNMDNYIEHPLSSIIYYFEHEAHKNNVCLNYQLKYMGSRAYILAFKDIETARVMGFTDKIIVNSRGGFKFFEDEEILDGIHQDIFNPKNKYDYIMLDCEILPWMLKAGPMVNGDFKTAIEASLISKFKTSQDFIDDLTTYETLQKFTEGENIEIYPFHLLYAGCLRKDGNHYSGLHNLHTESFSIMNEIGLYDGNYIKECENNEFRINDRLSCCGHIEKMINKWLYYTGTSSLIEENYLENLNLDISKYHKERYEGFVIKPSNYTSYTQNGYFHQPALKVRGRNYLNLVYGLDVYNNSTIFDLVTNQKKIRPKRILANQQFELSKYMIDATIHKNKTQRLKLASAFLGMENINSNIDKTL